MLLHLDVTDDVDTDDQLETRVRALLQESRYASLRILKFCVKDGVVTLSGPVATFYEKQLAQETVRRVPGIERIENSLEVTSPASVRRASHPDRTSGNWSRSRPSDLT